MGWAEIWFGWRLHLVGLSELDIWLGQRLGWIGLGWVGVMVGFGCAGLEMSCIEESAKLEFWFTWVGHLVVLKIWSDGRFDWIGHLVREWVQQ